MRPMWNVLRFLTLSLLALCCHAGIAEEPPVLQWEQLPPLPDEFGFGGPLVGEYQFSLIVAGGANFPNGPPWAEGGEKVWHDRVFLLPRLEKEWILSGKLPYPLAYAAVVSTVDGTYILGGESYSADKQNYDTAGVLRININYDKRETVVKKNAFPPLPKPCSYHAAAGAEGMIYVAASHAESDQSRRLDSKSFWALNRFAIPSKEEWQELPPWPGKPRYKMALTSAKAKDEKGELRDHIFLFSGGSWAKDENGEKDPTKFEYYDDAYRYDPAAKQWTQLASLPKLRETREIDTTRYRYDQHKKSWVPLAQGEAQPENDIHALFDDQPRPAAAAVAVNDGRGRILLFSGATGRYDTMAVQDRPFFPREVLAYNIAADHWEVAGLMPQAVVTTGAVRMGNKIIIASGEVRPGVRTTKVQELSVE